MVLKVRRFNVTVVQYMEVNFYVLLLQYYTNAFCDCFRNHVIKLESDEHFDCVVIFFVKSFQNKDQMTNSLSFDVIKNKMIIMIDSPDLSK